jgi:hypothetical protein
MARLNMARSRVRPAICNLVRIDQTCFGRRGGFAPTSLPLFQGSRRGARGTASMVLHRGAPLLQRTIRMRPSVLEAIR